MDVHAQEKKNQESFIRSHSYADVKLAFNQVCLAGSRTHRNVGPGVAGVARGDSCNQRHLHRREFGPKRREPDEGAVCNTEDCW